MDLLEITAHISYVGGITEYEVLLDDEFRVNGKVYRTDIVQSDIDPSRGTYNPIDNKFRANDGPHWPVFGPDVTIAPPYTVRCTTQGFSYSIRYVDEAGNELIPSSYGVAYTNEWKDLTMEFSATLYDPGTEYIVKQQQAYPPANYVYNSATDAKVIVGPDAPVQTYYLIKCVKKPVPLNYTIHYVDESGNTLIPDISGSIPNPDIRTWIPLNTEFSATVYDAGNVYKIKQTQIYTASIYNYISASNAKVLVGRDTGTGSIYDYFRIICERFHSLLEGL